MGSLEGSAILPKFEEGRIPEQKVVENRLFPKVLGPAHQSQKENVEAFVQTILNNKEWLQKQVVDNGAVLFRGFSVRSGADLNMVVEAFGWEEQQEAVDIMGCAGLQCFEDGTAEFTFGPLKAIRTFEGQEGNNVWFNTIAGYGEGNHNQSLTLGDGDDIPVEAVNAFKRIMDEECVDLKWEEGDVLLLDNLSVQHARRPSKPPRRVLVSMCK
eukprot:Gb_34217 [translate_table: standard]